jgi:hypothetical protein
MSEKNRLRQVELRKDLLFAMATRLHPQIAARLRRLIDDLAVDDLPLALLDLAQLHRTISSLDAEELAQVRSALARATRDSADVETERRTNNTGEDQANLARSGDDGLLSAAPGKVNSLHVFPRSM